MQHELYCSLVNFRFPEDRLDGRVVCYGIVGIMTKLTEHMDEQSQNERHLPEGLVTAALDILEDFVDLLLWLPQALQRVLCNFVLLRAFQ
jgi:hypothetical protein